MHVNAHSGCDAWEEATDAVHFFEGALQMQQQILPSGIRLSHETHRGRPLGHPFVAGRLLRRLSELRITADVSHWMVCCERLLRCTLSSSAANAGRKEERNDTEARLMLLAAERTDHVRSMLNRLVRMCLCDGCCVQVLSTLTF